WLFNKLHHQRSGRGLLSFIANEAAVEQLKTARQAADKFFQDVAAWHAQQRTAGRPGMAKLATESVRVREANIAPDGLSEELVKLATRVDEAGADLEDEQKIEFTSVAERARKLGESLRVWLGQKLEGQVYWIDVTTGTPPKVELCSAPIEVGPALQE